MRGQVLVWLLFPAVASGRETPMRDRITDGPSGDVCETGKGCGWQSSRTAGASRGPAGLLTKPTTTIYSYVQGLWGETTKEEDWQQMLAQGQSSSLKSILKKKNEWAWDLAVQIRQTWMHGRPCSALASIGAGPVSQSPPCGRPKETHSFSDMFRTKRLGKYQPQRQTQDNKAGLLGAPTVTR